MPPTRNAPTHLLAVIIAAGSCLSSFATFATASQPAKLRTAVEKGMSPAGEMAAKARAALKKFGIHTFSAEEEKECVNDVEECEDGLKDGPNGGQGETSIAVDSTGQHIVVGFNDDRGFDLTPISVSGFLYSDDGGMTWVDGGQLPTNSSPGSVLPQVFGDPDVKYLGGCTFVYSSILVAPFRRTAVQTMGVHRSTDCGHTWAGPFEVAAATNPNRVLIGGEPADAADKEFMDVDPDTGRVLMSWTNFTPTSVEISTTFSDNVLTGNPPTWSTRRVVAATPADGQSSVPRFAGNGSNNAYVVWRRFPVSLGNTIAFARSTNNGRTWSAPKDITPPFFTMDQVLGNDRVNTSPSLAVDTSHGSNAGNIYVVYSNNNNGDGADVYLQRSTNGGVSFSTPIILNKAPGSDRAQWFPWVTVDQDTGKVSVFYYDQGVATSGDRTQVSFVVSTDGGRTFTRQRPLTATPFHAGWGNTTGQPNLGDYNQAVAQDGQLYAVWAGTSQAGFADNQPNLTLNVPDVYFRKFPASGAIVPAEMDLAVATGMRKAPLISADPAAEPSVITNLVRENFDEPGLPPRALPPGWSSQHGAGANTVPWITRSFCGTTSKTAFHQNANDAPDPTSSPSRWERLFSPPFTVPADTSFVVVEFDICYNTEDDPNFNILAYDGVFLRVTDLTPGRTLRSVLAEAFEERFVTGAKEHYPKHFPRSNDPNYFEDMSAWAGFSHGFKHVRIKLPGMEGSTAQLRFEFTQDAFGTCKDVRPKHSCGVAIDNVRVNAVK